MLGLQQLQLLAVAMSLSALRPFAVHVADTWANQHTYSHARHCLPVR